MGSDVSHLYFQEGVFLKTPKVKWDLSTKYLGSIYNKRIKGIKEPEI
jgi:hypothetical protein